MPSVTAAIEYLKQLERKGRGNAPVHIVDIEAEAEERKKNTGPKPKTRVQFETDDPELYSAFAIERERIVKRAKNVQVALTLMLEAWHEMTNAEIDRRMAEDGPE
jgi:hypothetical protein